MQQERQQQRFDGLLEALEKLGAVPLMLDTPAKLDQADAQDLDALVVPGNAVRGALPIHRGLRMAGVILVATLLAGCPDSVQPPKTPPGPRTPDAPRVPEPKAAHAVPTPVQSSAVLGKMALTVVPPSRLDCTLKCPP